MAITDLCIKKPIVALGINAFILLFGLIALTNMPLRQYPDLGATTISVTVNYPGAVEEKMQGYVTSPISHAVSSVEGVDYIRSETTQGLSKVFIKLKLGADYERAFTDITASIDSIRYILPPDSTDPVLTALSSDPTAVTYIAVNSPNHSISQITDYINRAIIPGLASVTGTGRLDIVGGQELSVRIWLNPLEMVGAGISATDVKNSLSSGHIVSVGGSLKNQLVISDVVPNTEYRSIEELQEIIIQTQGERHIKLQDVATIEFGPKSVDQTAFSRGAESVFIAVNASPEGNPLIIMDEIRSRLPGLIQSAPTGMNIEIGFDVTRFINSSLEEIAKTIVEAILIVVLVMFLFLGKFKVVVIPIVAIPISLIGSALFMLFFGFSINLLTLLAMVLAIGLVVDDAIVIVENIYRHVQNGLSATEAALVGAREVIGPIISMTITLAAVYAPIGLVGGLTGSLFMEFAFTLASAVIISGVVALTVSPIMTRYAIDGQPDKWGKVVESFFERLSKAYEHALTVVLKLRALVVFLAILLSIGSYYLFNGAPNELAPAEDQGYIYTAIEGPNHIHLNYMESFTQQMDQIFQAIPEFHDSFMVNGPKPNQSFGGIILKPWADRERSQPEILAQIQGESTSIDGISVFAFSGAPLPGSNGGFPLQMVLTSQKDILDLYEVANGVITKASGSGIFTVINTDFSAKKPVLNVDFDRKLMNEVDIDMADIADAMNVFLSENFIARMGVDGKYYEIIPQVGADYRTDSLSLDDYYVRSSNGEMMPLSLFTQVNEGAAPSVLTQYNQLNSILIRGIIDPRYSLAEAMDYLTNLSTQNIPADVSVDWLGESRQLISESGQFHITFLLCLFFIYLVLAIQFNSLRDPFIILVSVPLSLFGALLPLYFELSSVNIYSKIGLLTLIGLITKHGILMVQFANRLRINEGLDKIEAIKCASVVRLRPILMTTAAIVIGLVPLILSSGAGSEARFSIGVVIVSGMLLGTLFTLFVLPNVYIYLSSESCSESKL